MLPRLPRGSTRRPSRGWPPPPPPPPAAHRTACRGAGERVAHREEKRTPKDKGNDKRTNIDQLPPHHSPPKCKTTLPGRLDRPHHPTQEIPGHRTTPLKTTECFIARPCTTKNMSHYKRTRTINPQNLQHRRRDEIYHDKLEPTGRANSKTNEGDLRPTQGRAETHP